MPIKQPTTELRDFSAGRITTYSANNALIPKNSAYFSQNVNFDEVVGSVKVRPGTTAMYGVVASNKTPLGLNEFVGSGFTPNLLLSVYSGATNASLYYYDGTWHTSTLTTLSNTAKNRFAQLGGKIFRVNGVDAMNESIDGNTWTTTNSITTVLPAYIYKFKSRLLVSGYSSFKDRVYFSSIINQNASPFLTWNIDPTTGDWIDINPDDGDQVVGFSDASDLLLAFKTKAFYRLNVVTKSVDTENIYNVGATSQEAIDKCQGMVYFFSGDAIYRTNGGFPEQISRLGVQDFIDNIPQDNWKDVTIGHDTWNVYVSIGTVTLNNLYDTYKNRDTYTNVVLKFSVRDQNWSIHNYPTQLKFFARYTDSNGRKTRFAGTDGYVQTLNLGQTDRGTPIFYRLETQELEWGNRSQNDSFTDKLVVYSDNGLSSKIQYQIEDKDWKNIDYDDMNKTVNVMNNINISGKYFKIAWFGISTGKPPLLHGFFFDDFSNEGVIE